MNTCRICGKYDEPLFKYSVRHYAHADCAFNKWGAKFLGMIPTHQICRLPYRAVKRAGLELEVALHVRFAQGD